MRATTAAPDVTPVTEQYTRYVALHPLRGSTPVTGRYTRYGALHPNRRGVMPTDRVHRLIGNKLERGFPR